MKRKIANVLFVGVAKVIEDISDTLVSLRLSAYIRHKEVQPKKKYDVNWSCRTHNI